MDAKNTPQGVVIASDFTTTIPVSLNSGNSMELQIEDIGTNQTLRIGNEVLFESGRSDLSPGGEAALQILAKVISSCSSVLTEVQIQGHTDRTAYTGGQGNLGLAADRAMAVYNYFVQEGIDPRNLLLSAASYAEFKPVDRQAGIPYDWNVWEDETPDEMQANRRVEFHLIYRLAPSASPENSECTPVDQP